MSILSDLRITSRTLAKNPAFTLTAVAALALGIGANTAIFSVVNEVLLNPAGVRNPERVVALRAKYDKLALRSIPVSVPDFEDVHKSTQLFEYAAMEQPGTFNYTGSGVPERLVSASVSVEWFNVFGAKPRLGRMFEPAEDKPNANHVVVLSFGAWKRLFGQDAGALGKTIELNQTPYRIVGVMGPEFNWPANVDIWVPLGLEDSAYDPRNRFNESYNAFVRLKAGVKPAQASAWVELLNNRVRSDGTQLGGYAKDSLWGMFLVPFTDFIAGDTKTPMLVLLGAVGFVLLIACSNVAGLMLARASGRSRELAVRAALGASRRDLILQTLNESLVLACSGAVLGLLLAWVGASGLIRLAPENSGVALDVHIDTAVLVFTALAAMASGLLFGIAPAWQISRLDRFEALKEGGRSGTSGLSRQRLRAGLVIGEVALALALLVGAGLFLRSLASLRDVNPGFQPHGVITGFVSLPPAQYSDPAKQTAFYESVLERLRNLPGVTAAAAGLPVPFSGLGGSSSFAIEGRPAPPGDPGPHSDIGDVSPDYFAALKIPIRSGRVFSAQDQRNTAPVVVIDDTLAREYWASEDPIGKHLRGGRSGPWWTVVGVVGHVKQSDLAGDVVKGRRYYSLNQTPVPFATFIVRSSADPARLTAALQQAVQEASPGLAVSQIKLLDDMVAASLAARRFVVMLLGVFAAMALVMAIIGLYGVISYSVAQRTQEVGIRMALGAQPAQVLRLVIGQGLKLAAIGATAGLAVSAMFSRLLKSQLFGVSAFDPLTFIGTALVLIAASLAACYIPARRATRVDPMEALRYE